LHTGRAAADGLPPRRGVVSPPRTCLVHMRLPDV